MLLTDQLSISVLRNRQLICKVVLSTTYAIVGSVAILQLIGLASSHSYGIGRFLVYLLAAAYVVGSHALIRKKRYYAASSLIILFYFILATGVVWEWGINTPIAPLLLGLVVVMSGILLSARVALYAALIAFLDLVVLQILNSTGMHHPDISWVRQPPSLGDASVDGIIFIMLAVISWLYNREMERSLLQARNARDALELQKENLEEEVKKRTAELRKAQLEELRQVYRFAELGQQGVNLLHEVGNHLTVLSLEIEGLQRQRQAEDVKSIREITAYLERILDSARDRLQGGSHLQSFDIGRKIDDTIAFLKYKARRNDVALVWRKPQKPLPYIGDAMSLSQVIAIISNNAIDAYGDIAEKREVEIALKETRSDIQITIRNWGKPIPPKLRKEIFKPARTTKQTGMGLGLYIALNTIRTNFSGRLNLSKRTDCTEFVIVLPKSHAK